MCVSNYNSNLCNNPYANFIQQREIICIEVILLANRLQQLAVWVVGVVRPVCYTDKMLLADDIATVCRSYHTHGNALVQRSHSQQGSSIHQEFGLTLPFCFGKNGAHEFTISWFDHFNDLACNHTKNSSGSSGFIGFIHLKKICDILLFGINHIDRRRRNPFLIGKNKNLYHIPVNARSHGTHARQLTIT